VTEKCCFKCGDTKPLDEFYAHPQMGDGHLNKCKDCAKKDIRQHRIKNPEKVREYDRQRARLPHRFEERMRRHAEYAEANPEKRAAHWALGRAVRDGKVQKLPCAFCGEAENLEAHHHDYSKPLDVTWLCRPCHRRFHALERMATYDREAA
jgi:hypothetical protein